MSLKSLTLSMLLGFLSLAVAFAGAAPADVGPQFKSAGPLAFGPENVLFVADNLAAVIYALELDGQASGKTAGTKDVPGIDQKIAGLLGTDAREITITDRLRKRYREAFSSNRRRVVEIARRYQAGCTEASTSVDFTELMTTVIVHGGVVA